MPRFLALAAALCIGAAHGHPLGNNTVNREVWIRVAPEGLSLRYLVDMAEIPTLLAAQEADADGDGETTATEWDLYAQRRGEEIRAGIALAADGAPLTIGLDAVRSESVPGDAGLATLRIEALLAAPLGAYAGVRIDYLDRRRPDEVGWKAVVASAGDGVEIARSDAPRASPTDGLESYPAAGGPTPNVLTARIEARAAPLAGAPPMAESASQGQALGTAACEPEDRPPGAPVQGARARPSANDRSPPASAQPPSPPAPVWAFFRLGLNHIANGLDHLVFLLGLMWTQRSLRGLVWVVTAFTAAHSLTLGLATAGLLAPPTAWVNPAIGLTIAYVGVANLRGGLRHGPAVAFGFGLIHGFGFAGALAEHLGTAQAGSGGWLLDLAMFNLGVETGQLAFVAMVLALGGALRILDLQWAPAARILPGYLVGLLGAYWTLQPLLAALAGSR